MIQKFRSILILVGVLLLGCQQTEFQQDTKPSILSNERFPEPVTLTAADIEWFRHCRVAWIHAEAGAPAIVIPGETIESSLELLGDKNHPLTQRFERVFITFAIYASLDTGTYTLKTNGLIGETPVSYDSSITFNLTQKHIELLRKAWWRKGYIDFKYPYGNYHFYEADMAKALGEEVRINNEDVFELSHEELTKYQKLHQQSLLSLLAFIQHSQIKPDEYQLQVDGWDFAPVVRLQPPTQQQINRYMKQAAELKFKFAKGIGDKYSEWEQLNLEFAKIVDN